MTQLVEVVGGPLPAGAQIVGVESVEGQDDALRAKLVMAEDDVQALLKTVGLSDDDFVEGRVYLFGPDKEWWDPQTAQALKVAQRSSPAAGALNVGLAAAGAGEMRTVYIFWHQL